MWQKWIATTVVPRVIEAVTVELDCAEGISKRRRRTPQWRRDRCFLFAPKLNRDLFWCLSLYTGSLCAAGRLLRHRLCVRLREGISYLARHCTLCSCVCVCARALQCSQGEWTRKKYRETKQSKLVQNQVVGIHSHMSDRSVERLIIERASGCYLFVITIDLLARRGCGKCRESLGRIFSECLGVCFSFSSSFGVEGVIYFITALLHWLRSIFVLFVGYERGLDDDDEMLESPWWLFLWLGVGGNESNKLSRKRLLSLPVWLKATR